MELSVRHLISRSGIYYFRYRLPGKNLEIKVSLRTSDQVVNSHLLYR